MLLKGIKRGGLSMSSPKEFNGYTFQHVDQYNGTEVVHKTQTVSLGQLLEDFELFLRGCGFSFSGHVQIVEDSFFDDDSQVDDDDRAEDDCSGEDVEGSPMTKGGCL